MGTDKGLAKPGASSAITFPPVPNPSHQIILLLEFGRDCHLRPVAQSHARIETKQHGSEPVEGTVDTPHWYVAVVDKCLLLKI